MKKNFELFFTFFKIGLFTFGGGLSMLPILEREIITKKKWAKYENLLDYYSIGQVTPGIIAVNVSTFIGLKINGILGSIFATLGVITPSVIIISLLSSIIKNNISNIYFSYFLSGIRLGVCSLLIITLIKLIKSGIKNKVCIIFLIVSFIASFFFSISSIIIVLISLLFCFFISIINRKDKNQ